MKKDWLSALAALGMVCSAAAQSRTFNFEDSVLTAIQDAPQTMAQSLFPQITAEEFAALAGGGEAQASFNAFLLRRGKSYILFDTGNGGGAVLEFDSGAEQIRDSGTFALESQVSVHLGYKDDCAQVFAGEVTEFRAI